MKYPMPPKCRGARPIHNTSNAIEPKSAYACLSRFAYSHCIPLVGCSFFTSMLHCNCLDCGNGNGVAIRRWSRPLLEGDSICESHAEWPVGAQVRALYLRNHKSAETLVESSAIPDRDRESIAVLIYVFSARYVLFEQKVAANLLSTFQACTNISTLRPFTNYPCPYTSE